MAHDSFFQPQIFIVSMVTNACPRSRAEHDLPAVMRVVLHQIDA